MGSVDYCPEGTSTRIKPLYQRGIETQLDVLFDQAIFAQQVFPDAVGCEDPTSLQLLVNSNKQEENYSAFAAVNEVLAQGKELVAKEDYSQDIVASNNRIATADINTYRREDTNSIAADQQVEVNGKFSTSITNVGSSDVGSSNIDNLISSSLYQQQLKSNQSSSALNTNIEEISRTRPLPFSIPIDFSANKQSVESKAEQREQQVQQEQRIQQEQQSGQLQVKTQDTAFPQRTYAQVLTKADAVAPLQILLAAQAKRLNLLSQDPHLNSEQAQVLATTSSAATALGTFSLPVTNPESILREARSEEIGTKVEELGTKAKLSESKEIILHSLKGKLKEELPDLDFDDSLAAYPYFSSYDCLQQMQKQWSLRLGNYTEQNSAFATEQISQYAPVDFNQQANTYTQANTGTNQVIGYSNNDRVNHQYQGAAYYQGSGNYQGSGGYQGANNYQATGGFTRYNSQIPLQDTLDAQLTAQAQHWQDATQHSLSHLPPEYRGFYTTLNPSKWVHLDDPAAKAKVCLQEAFGLREFRGLQEQVIHSLLTGHDTMAIMATGMGKSICYQVPGLCLPGVTLVVSPLLALMIDQVEQLNTIGVGAAVISSSTSPIQKQAIFQAIHADQCKFLYISPEKLASDYTLREISHLPVSLIAIDEAHCVSQWGHDFRPDYQRLYRIRESFNYYIPILACTATARLNTRDDIAQSLHLNRPAVYIGDFNRPNIEIIVKNVDTKQEQENELLKLLRAAGNQPAIVYCYARKTVETVHALLVKRGIKATRYHAHLPSFEKDSNQQEFMAGHVEVMVATIAFGMGINKSNIRLVVHYDYPSTLENYYQEIGRAGRDGLPSRAVLFNNINNRDWRIDLIYQEFAERQAEAGWQTQAKQQGLQGQQGSQRLQVASGQQITTAIVSPKLKQADFLSDNPFYTSGSQADARWKALEQADMMNPLIDEHPENSAEMKFKKLKEVFNFADTYNCRRKVLLSAFNQVLEHDCNNCDNCLGRRSVNLGTINIAEDAHFILGLIIVFKSMISFDTLLQVIMKKASIAAELQRAFELKAGNCISQEEYNRLQGDVDNLDNWVQRISVKVEEAHQYGINYWRTILEQMLELGYLAYDRKYNFMRITPIGQQLLRDRGSIEMISVPNLVRRNVFDLGLIRDLELIRQKFADVRGVRNDMILSDPTIDEIVKVKPTQVKDLQKINGMTAAKLSYLAEVILGAVILCLKRKKLNDPNLLR